MDGEAQHIVVMHESLRLCRLRNVSEIRFISFHAVFLAFVFLCFHYPLKKIQIQAAHRQTAAYKNATLKKREGTNSYQKVHSLIKFHSSTAAIDTARPVKWENGKY